MQYIEVDEQDLRLAHPLAAHFLGRSLDELAPPTRSFLLAVHELISRIEKIGEEREEAIYYCSVRGIFLAQHGRTVQ